jgi:hypothetical protein
VSSGAKSKYRAKYRVISAERYNALWREQEEFDMVERLPVLDCPGERADTPSLADEQDLTRAD